MSTPTKEDLAKARELVARWVGTLGMAWRHSANFMSTESDIAQALADARAEEREMCARLADHGEWVAYEIANEIRARGGK